MLNGIDVSSYQKFSSYDALNDTNHAFVFIKASESVRQDPMFNTHNSGFAKTKLLKGAYHFLRFSHSGADQAKAFINTVGQMSNLDLPPVLDIEDVSENLSVEACIEIVKEWLKAVHEKFNVKPIIYTGAWYWKDKGRLDDTNLFKDYPLWVSAYSTSYPAPFGGWTIPAFWQYSEKGQVNGLSNGQAIDLNKFLGDINGLWNLLPASKPSEYSKLGDKVRAVQFMLKKIEPTLVVDGAWGNNSIAALHKWQHSLGFAESDKFDPVQWQTLFELNSTSTPSVQAPLRVGAPVFPESAVVMADLLNIRSAVGTASPLVSSPLPKGKMVTVLEENNGWYRVKTQIEGWVSKQHIQLQN